MTNGLEISIRGWEVEVPDDGAEGFKANIARVLKKTGFMRKGEYWENEIGGLRLYETNRHTGCCTETLGFSIKSPYMLEGIPPVVVLIEQEIYAQKWNSIRIR